MARVPARRPVPTTIDTATSQPEEKKSSTIETEEDVRADINII